MYIPCNEDVIPAGGGVPGLNLIGDLLSAVCMPIPNGCGPFGFLDEVVPECPFDVLCFTEPCSDHDLCYAECGQCRQVCDLRFFDEMASLCREAFQPSDDRYAECMSLATLYTEAVVLFGQPFFLITQDIGCECRGGVPRAPKAAATVTDAELAFVDSLVVDSDRDLLPDEWEMEFGLDPTNPDDAKEDWDCDGLSNLGEFVYRLDPSHPDDTTPLSESTAQQTKPR